MRINFPRSSVWIRTDCAKLLSDRFSEAGISFPCCRRNVPDFCIDPPLGCGDRGKNEKVSDGEQHNLQKKALCDHWDRHVHHDVYKHHESRGDVERDARVSAYLWRIPKAF